MKTRNAFTLIELLIVVAVIALLATIVTAAAGQALKASREKRVKVSISVLETALARYRSEYNEWPGGESVGKDEKSHTFSGADNASVFGPLREKSQANSDKIRFIDETAFYTISGSKVVPLSGTTGDKPLVFVPRSGKGFGYFTVRIDFESDTATVSAPKYDDRSDD